MTHNNNGAQVFKSGSNRSKQEAMELYDALPKEYRDVLKYTVANLTYIKPICIRKQFRTSKTWNSWIKQKEVIGTRDTYGRSHPDFVY